MCPYNLKGSMHSCPSMQWVGLPHLAASPTPESRHLQQLGLKWRSSGEVREDFKGYLELNCSGNLLATGASIS